ncbi:cupin domain-containing protein [Carboxylicivirga taeanensis]|uniref:cupin domain-containing protein n=1 Tax=Carboxylicivirga taeanensis TaxID=1416875 RepID=UPI003F6E101D
MKHKTLLVNEKEVKGHTWSKAEEIEHCRKKLIDAEHVNKLYCDVYEIPPGKANWPLHFHTCNEEVFYITEGHGEVVTENGVSKVKPGDILRFPAGEKGVHQLKNTSDSETLKYLDVGTNVFPDVVFMPADKQIELFEGTSGQDKIWSYND